MLPLLDVQFEWCFADAKLSLLKYGYFVTKLIYVDKFVTKIQVCTTWEPIHVNENALYHIIYGKTINSSPPPPPPLP